MSSSKRRKKYSFNFECLLSKQVSIMQQPQQQEKDIDVYYILKPIFFFSRFCGLWVHSLKVTSCFALKFINNCPCSIMCYSFSLSDHRRLLPQRVYSITVCCFLCTSIASTLISTVNFGSPSLAW